MPATNTNTDAASSSPATPSAPKQQADEVAPSLAFRALKVLAVLGIFYFAGGWQYLLESLNGSVPMALLVTSFFLFAGFITDTNDMVGQPHED